MAGLYFKELCVSVPFRFRSVYSFFLSLTLVSKKCVSSRDHSLVNIIIFMIFVSVAKVLPNLFSLFFMM